MIVLEMYQFARLHMINCLCCGESINEPASDFEITSGWHKRCVKKFFGTSSLPDIDIDDNKLIALANNTTQKGITVPGVQKKLSLHLSKGNRNVKPRLTIVDYPSGYILKPQTEEYPYLPESEYLVMRMANLVGIKVVPFALIKQGDNIAYITKRIDRVINSNSVHKLAMEDFCQLSGRQTNDKYHGSYERCSKLVFKYSSRVMIDITELFIRIVFSYLVGNSDMHLKNISLIETSERSSEYILSDAYDLLPVNIILPSDKEELALTINGKTRNLTRKDFLVLAQYFKLDKKVAERMIQKLLSRTDDLINLTNESLISSDMKEKMVDLIKTRASVLSA